jgi:transcriptional repressor NrdR
MYLIKLQNPICSTYINFVFQNSFHMVKTRKSSSRPPKKKGKADSRIRSKSRKVNPQRRRRSRTTRQSPKAAGRTRTKKRTKISDIIIKRTSGRREKFETDKMAQTVSRSGTPFLLARDVAKTVSEKVMRRGNDTSAKGGGGGAGEERTSSPSTIEVDAGEVRKMVTEELKERNRPDIASSYSGERPENTRQGRHELMKENQPLHDADAANQSKLLFDSSTNMAKSTRPSTMKR